ncbi:MFS transporter [Nocardia niwae]|uniref:MFS transporter n=1 Tax=Nocardia niwae TaxID=626084 RepID=UPI0007A48B01|nr:MFS transporter [Nocardia niwae]
MSTTPQTAIGRLRDNRGFTAILASAAISSTGDGIRLAALPLLAITITNDPVAVSGVAIANRLPWLVVALLSGAIADRYRRRTIMVIADAARAAIGLALVAAIVTDIDHLVVLYVAAVALGIGETLYSSAAQGFLPEVVASQHLPAANGRLFTVSMVGSNFFGPMVGSWLFGLGRAIPFLLDAISFGVGLLLISSVTETTPSTLDRNRTSLLQDVRAGIAWLLKHPLMRSFTVVVTVVNLTQGASQALLVLLAVTELGMSTTTFGFIIAAGGVGGFLGGMLAQRIGDWLSVPKVLLPGIAITCPLFLVMAWTHQPIVLGIAVAINAFAGVLANVQMVSLRQRLVPNNFLGRIGSVNQFLAFGIAIPLGALGGGFLAQVSGVRAVYTASAIVIFMLVIAVAKSMRPRAVADAIAKFETTASA